MTWDKFIRPLFFKLPAESAHHAAMKLFARMSKIPGVARRLRSSYFVDDSRLNVEQFGLRFQNPVGLAAGFDKAGVWFNELANLGFGCIEIGTVTGQAQPGNPKPRMFRLPEDQALINRMGFNSAGCVAVANALRSSVKNRDRQIVLGINIGKSKVVELADAPAEHQQSFERLFPFADYFTINVSSPNTPNLRELQNREHLISIIESVHESNERLSHESGRDHKPVLLKIAPDLTDLQLVEIATVAREYNLDGIIATNTTISRENLKTNQHQIDEIGAGGLSGRPLKNRSLEVVSRLYRELRGSIPIVGVGGIMNGTDAWNMIAAGANLVQVYTGFIYGGPSFVRGINVELIKRLEQHKLGSIAEATGIENSS